MARPLGASRRRAPAILAAVVALAAPAAARARPAGVPDAGFGAAGVARIALPGGDVTGFALIPEGNRLVAAGWTRGGATLLAGLSAAGGAPDAALGSLTTWPGADPDGVAALREPGGRLVVATNGTPGDSSADRTQLLGFDATGHLDAAFGAGGRLTLAAPLQTGSLAQAADGTLLVAGTAPGKNDFAFDVLRLTRVSADGHELGTASIPWPAGGENGPAVARVLPLADGAALVAGSDDRLFLARFTAGGAVDAAFGTAGVKHLDSGRQVQLDDATLQGPGHVLLAGARIGDLGRSVDVPHHALLLRATLDGTLDHTLAPVGRGITDGVSELTSVRATAASIYASSDDGRVVRFGAGGRPDLRFGVAAVSTPPKTDVDTMSDLSVTPGGALLVGRSYLPEEVEQIAVERVRLTGSGILPARPRRRVQLSRRAGHVAVRVPIANAGQPLTAPATVPLEPRVVGTDEEEGIFTPPATILDARAGTVRVAGVGGRRADVRHARVTLRRSRRGVAELDLAPGCAGPHTARFRLDGHFVVRYGKRLIRNQSTKARFLVRRCTRRQAVLVTGGRVVIG